MFSFAAVDAGKGKTNASKAIPAGCLKTRKRNGKNYWYAQWREEGKTKSKEIGLCSKMDRMKAEGILTEILKPINEGAENPEKNHMDPCEVLRGRLPSGMPPEVEGFHRHG